MAPRSDWSAAIEISDLLVDVDPGSGERRSVRRTDVEAALETIDDRWGIALVRRLPAPGDVIDDLAVDRLLVAVHSELSRLGQELAQAPRLRALLVPVLDELRATGVNERIQVVDVGCGLGYTLRWLARWGALGDDVDLVGCDLNPALVAEARRLADLDRVRCEFVAANAFTRRVAVGATVLTSAGLVHHFRGEDLTAFFAAHDPASVGAFIHYDVTPKATWLRYAGAWMFHLARMRLAISRHDGVISVMRSHSDAVLASAAVAGAPWADVSVLDPATTGSVFLNVMRPVVGLSPELADGIRDRLGSRAARLVPADAVR